MKELVAFKPGEKIKYSRARLKEESLQKNMGEKDMKDTLNTTERLCYHLLVTRSDMSAADIRDLLPTSLEDLSLWMGKTIRQTQRTLKSLQEKGWLESKGKREFGKACVYRLTVDEDYRTQNNLTFDNSRTGGLRVIEGGKNKREGMNQGLIDKDNDDFKRWEEEQNSPTSDEIMGKIPIGN